MTPNSGRTPGTDPVVSGVLQEDWDYANADTQHLTHNIHRYSGKFIPQIASRAIELLSDPGDIVVDPYCGSGTTLVECALRRRRGIGIDLNPLAVLISKVKTTPIRKPALDELAARLARSLSGLAIEDELPLFRANPPSSPDGTRWDTRLQHEWYTKWFQPQVLSDLVQIDLEISKIRERALRDVARVAFSDILRRSSNAHSGYPNVMFDRNAPRRPRPVRPFLRSLRRAIAMVGTLAEADGSWNEVTAVQGDAASLPIQDESVDAVVSHPPYIGSIPYAEYGALSLQWLGVDPKELDRRLTGGRRQSRDVVTRFEEGYARMLRESGRILKPGHYAFLMVGSPVVRGTVIDLSDMTLDLAPSANLELIIRTSRKGANRRANKMGAEQLLFFRKVTRKPSRGAPTPDSAGNQRDSGAKN